MDELLEALDEAFAEACKKANSVLATSRKLRELKAARDGVVRKGIDASMAKALVYFPRSGNDGPVDCEFPIVTLTSEEILGIIDAQIYRIANDMQAEGHFFLTEEMKH